MTSTPIEHPQDGNQEPRTPELNGLKTGNDGYALEHIIESYKVLCSHQKSQIRQLLSVIEGGGLEVGSEFREMNFGDNHFQNENIRLRAEIARLESEAATWDLRYNGMRERWLKAEKALRGRESRPK